VRWDLWRGELRWKRIEFRNEERRSVLIVEESC